MRRAIVAILVSTVALAGRAQTASVTGRVVADATGDPIPNVRVALTSAAAGSPVLTDGDGRFVLPAPAGRQSVIASKSGYARSEPTAVSAGQPIEIRLRRGATISGRVVDRFGEAAAAARVAAQTPAADPAKPTTVATVETDDRGAYRIPGLSAGKYLVTVNNLRSVTTPRVIADRQIFETRSELVRTYYPGTTTPEEAQPLEVAFGDERSDIDFVVSDEHIVGNPFSIKRIGSPLQPPPLPASTVATAIVRGRVLSTDGRSLAHADVSLVWNRTPFMMRRSETDADGARHRTRSPRRQQADVAALRRQRAIRFSRRLARRDGDRLLAVPSQDSARDRQDAERRRQPDIIVVDRGRSNSWTEGEFASMPVAVNGDGVKDLLIQTSSGSSIKGRVTFDSYNNTKLPRQSALEITPVPVDYDLSPAAPASANVHDDWSFDIVGVNGPRRLQALRVPPGWALKEVRVNRIDATDRPLAFGRRDQSLTDVEVVLSDRVSELVGTIADDNARPVPGARVVVFPTNRDRWYPGSPYFGTAAADADSVFAVTGLPFGVYYAAPLARLPAEGADAWQDPAYLESLITRGRTFTIGGDGDKVAVNLRISTR